MNSAQKKNFFTKVAIVIIVLAAVSIYMFTMRANASNNEDGGMQLIKHVTFHFDGREYKFENKGELTEMPPMPKIPMNFFVGWYTADDSIYVPSESYAETNLEVFARFKSFKSVINDFLEGGDYAPDGLDYAFESQNESIIIKTRTFHEHPLENQMCKIEYDIFSGNGVLVLQTDLDSYEICFKILIDYSNIDYYDFTKKLFMQVNGLTILSFGLSSEIVDSAREAILYLCDDITSAVEKLVRHIAKKHDFRY